MSGNGRFKTLGMQRFIPEIGVIYYFKCRLNAEMVIFLFPFSFKRKEQKRSQFCLWILFVCCLSYLVYPRARVSLLYLRIPLRHYNFAVRPIKAKNSEILELKPVAIIGLNICNNFLSKKYFIIWFV